MLVTRALQAAKRDLASVEERLATQSALLKVRSESLQTIDGSTSITLADKQKELERVAQQVAAERSKLAGLARECRDSEVLSTKRQRRRKVRCVSHTFICGSRSGCSR